MSLAGKCRRALRAVRSRVFPRPPTFQTEAYSQEGEDLILQRIFMGKSTGYYVDVGAHHPKRFSNTYLFYQKGWSGINLDAMPGSMEAFRRERPRDINLELAIGSDSGSARTFWIFDEPALNTFDEALAKRSVGGPYNRTIIATRQVPTRPLSEVFATHLPVGIKIDFLTVDVEGLDLEVLRTNDWSRFRPDFVLAECPGVSAVRLAGQPICEFVASHGYEFFAKTVNTVFFKDSNNS